MMAALVSASLGWTPSLGLGPTSLIAQCDATSFPEDLGDTQCHGLHKIASATAEGDCCSACLEDYGCLTYGWCPVGAGCDTRQNVQGCWIGGSTNCRNTTEGWVSRRRPLAPLANDYLYTHFHAQPLKNWLNDPNGMMYFKGVYHLFFQYNPRSKAWGDMHWCGAIGLAYRGRARWVDGVAKGVDAAHDDPSPKGRY